MYLCSALPLWSDETRHLPTPCVAGILAIPDDAEVNAQDTKDFDASGNAMLPLTSSNTGSSPTPAMPI